MPCLLHPGYCDLPVRDSSEPVPGKRVSPFDRDAHGTVLVNGGRPGLEAAEHAASMRKSRAVVAGFGISCEATSLPRPIPRFRRRRAVRDAPRLDVRDDGSKPMAPAPGERCCRVPGLLRRWGKSPATARLPRDACARSLSLRERFRKNVVAFGPRGDVLHPLKRCVGRDPALHRPERQANSDKSTRSCWPEFRRSCTVPCSDHTLPERPHSLLRTARSSAPASAPRPELRH